jgi:hypothetical protein
MVAMPTPKDKRNYKEEYRDFHGKPEQKKRRAQRNKDRAKAEDQGRVRKGDGKEVDHVNPTKKGSLGKKTRVVSRETNRKRGHPKK